MPTASIVASSGAGRYRSREFSCLGSSARGLQPTDCLGDVWLKPWFLESGYWLRVVSGAGFACGLTTFVFFFWLRHWAHLTTSHLSPQGPATRCLYMNHVLSHRPQRKGICMRQVLANFSAELRLSNECAFQSRGISPGDRPKGSSTLSSFVLSFPGKFRKSR